MIDLHTHLLPNVDDGSTTLSQSLEQLSIISQAGVRKIYLTPHFMRHLYHNTRAVINPVFRELQSAADKAGIKIDLELGCELFIDNHSKETLAEEGLTMGDSRYVLFETTLQQIPEDIFELTYAIRKSGYRLIMAHPERYSDIIRNPDIIEDFLHRDILLQLNAGSLLGLYGRNVEHTAIALLDKGYAHFIGSDNHGNQKESVQAIAFKYISERYSEKIARELCEINPGKIATDEKIEVFNHWRLPANSATTWHKLRKFFTGYE
jgi:protein-tyrosine phosphatase